MASSTPTDSSLSNVYEDRIGEPANEDEVRGYWLFALGVVLGIVGVLMFLTSQSAGVVREWAIVLASTGLVLLIAGPTIRLPLQAAATWIVYAGAAVSAVAIAWFVVAYPAQWSPQTGQLTIIGLYAVGVLVIAAGGAFVPILTNRDDGNDGAAALQSDLEDRRAELGDAESEAAALDEEVASLQSALADAEADNADLEREVEQLRADLADAETDQTDLAAPVTEQETSQAQFELYEDRGEEWRWRLRHRNGNIIAGSTEGYTRKNNAQNGMQAVRRDASGATVLLVESEEDLPETGTDEGFVSPDTVESQATFELYEDRGEEEFRWRLRHDNGQVLADAREGYASREGAQTSIDRIREYVGPAEYLQPEPTAVEVYRDEADEWRWRLRHRNGNILAGSGEGYADRGGAREVIDRLREGIDEMAIEVYEDEVGGFRWRQTGGDDKVKVDSGSYESRDGAQKAVERVRTFLPEADLVDVGEAAFEIYEDEGGEHRWRLRHRNGNILAGDGQGYADRSGVWDGVESMKRHAPNAGFEATDE